MSNNSDDLIAIVRDAYENLRQIAYEKTGERLFDGASIQLITATGLLVRRAKLPRILFRFDQDPDPLQAMGNVLE
jgi:hypothetical protein